MSENKFIGMPIAHAAVNGGMLYNFGRIYAEQLAQRGAKMYFYASKYSISGSLPKIDEFIKMGGFFIGLPITQRANPILIIRSIIIMSLDLRKKHIKILHTRSSIMGVVGRIAAKIARVPIIIHHQDDLFCREDRLSFLKRRVVAEIEKRLSSLADISLFISEAVYKEAIRIGFRKEKCKIVGMDLNPVFHNVPSNYQNKDKNKIIQQIGIPENKKVVGCIARLSYIKGVDLFVAVAKKLLPKYPDWIFVIKGNGPMKEWLVNEINKSNINQGVYVIDSVLDKIEMTYLYRCFDIFFLPTRREGFGMAFVEAMSIGIPVVAPRIPPITENVSEDCGVLFEKESVESMFNALNALMSNDINRQTLGENGRKYANSIWRGDSSATRVIDVYDRLIIEKKSKLKHARCNNKQ